MTLEEKYHQLYDRLLEEVGGDGSGCGCLIAIAVVVVLILIVLGG